MGHAFELATMVRCGARLRCRRGGVHLFSGRVLRGRDSPTVEQLLKGGWQIAGYSQAGDNRSTFILFRRPDESYLVQCRVGYDVSRQPSTYAICYELR